MRDYAGDRDYPGNDSAPLDALSRRAAFYSFVLLPRFYRASAMPPGHGIEACSALGACAGQAG